MSMPIDLVLVRHGESEGNLAQHRSKKGDDSDWNSDFTKRHTSQYRLTDVGREQARIAGKFIREKFGRFDRYYVSEYVRARETAALMGLDGQWYVDFFLREQDRGVLGSVSIKNRQEKWAEELERRKLDEFYWCPPGGESVANACLRVNRVLSQLRRACSGFRVILVCHGNIMAGFRVCIEKLTSREYHEIVKNTKTYNGQILHYTRRNPKTGEIDPHFQWMRTFVPWAENVVDSSWIKIDRPIFSDADLLEGIKEPVPQLINNTLNEWPPELLKFKLKREAKENKKKEKEQQLQKEKERLEKLELEKESKLQSRSIGEEGEEPEEEQYDEGKQEGIKRGDESEGVGKSVEIKNVLRTSFGILDKDGDF